MADDASNQLFAIFEKIVSSMAFLPADILPWPYQIQALPVEYIASISGPRPVTVVVRCDRDFPALLAEAETGQASSDKESLDSFRELVNVLFGNLISDLWDIRSEGLHSFIPRPSTPAEAPLRSPDGICTIGIEHSVVQIAYWLGVSVPSSPMAAAHV